MYCQFLAEHQIGKWHQKHLRYSLTCTDKEYTQSLPEVNIYEVTQNENFKLT